MSSPKCVSWLGREPAAFLLTYLAVACLMLLAALAVKRLWIGILIPAVPALILCVVNYLKLSVNGIGLVVSDMALAGNAGTLMEFMPPKLRFPGWGILATVLLVGAVVAAKVLAPALPKDLQGKCRRGIAALIAVAVAAAVLLAPWFYYTGPKTENQAERDDRLGLLAGLYGGVLRAVSRL